MKFKYWALHRECKVSPSQIYCKLCFSGEEKRKKRQKKDGEEHYFYIRAIKFLYKQDI